MIYLAGDTHGELETYKVEDFFEKEAKRRELSEKDHLIILGDVGLYWDGGQKDERIRKRLENLPVTVLWLDGNHENFDLIDALPVTKWHGGMVQFTGEKIIHLMRGYVYEIEGRSFFAFGGGNSIDRIYRREGISWWRREMPSKEEYERGRDSLRRVGWQVDHVITHSVPQRIARQLVSVLYPGEDELLDYLQEIAMNTEFRQWYFGHWHMDCEIGEFIGLYDKIIRLEEKSGM